MQIGNAAGRTLQANYAPSPSLEIAPIFSELDRLDSALSALRGNVFGLREKVAPVACFVPATESKGVLESVAACAIEERIAAAIRAVNEIDTTAHDIYRALRV